MEAARTGDDMSSVVEQYFEAANLGDTWLDGDMVFTERVRAGADAPNVLVIGAHDLPASADRGEYVGADATAVRSPGIASRFGPLVAFVDGFKAALNVAFDEPVNIAFASLGGQTRPESAIDAGPMDDLDAVFLTSSVCWDPHQPTLTTGSRGRLILDVELRGGRAVDDATFAGAVRNPLNKLVEILGTIRDDRGRITIPGFYHRAAPPNEQERAALTSNGHDPDAWGDRLDVSRPRGALSATERATLWPVVSISDLRTDGTPHTLTPASATATLSLYLVPDQRPVEIEAAVRSWIESRVPADLASSVTLVSMDRPYRSAPGQQAVAAQARALTRVHGRPPVLVPGGGVYGAGELHFASGAPVGFAGICGPSTDSEPGARCCHARCSNSASPRPRRRALSCRAARASAALHEHPPR